LISPRTLADTGNNSPLLAIESTCDETAAAVLTRSGRVLGQCVATQELLHEQFGGVVPEIAARAHLERIVPVVRTALHEAGLVGRQLAAIAVADRPGLAGSLLVGVVAAKSLAIAWDKPLVAINHLHAHLFACTMKPSREGRLPGERRPPAEGNDSEEGVGGHSQRPGVEAYPQTDSFYPAVGLIVSGGHTSLYHCRNPLDLEYLGGTIDDAAGEAFDKVAAMLGLDFPGGVEVARLAREGDETAYFVPPIDDAKRGRRFQLQRAQDSRAICDNRPGTPRLLRHPAQRSNQGRSVRLLRSRCRRRPCRQKSSRGPASKCQKFTGRWRGGREPSTAKPVKAGGRHRRFRSTRGAA